MRIKNLIINNFMVIEQASLNLNDRGLVLIQGVNNSDSSASSNGSGKSSIAESISWGIYGETTRGLSGDSVVNKTEGKNCSVTLVVEDEKDVYQIIRYRKHEKHKNALEVYKKDERGAFKEITAGTSKLTQELVVKIIGCSYEVFKSAAYLGQEAMPDLPAMTDKQLKLLIEESAGIEKIEKAYELTKIKMNSINSKIISFKSDLKALESRKESNEERLWDIKYLRENLIKESEEEEKSLTTKLNSLLEEKEEKLKLEKDNKTKGLTKESLKESIAKLSNDLNEAQKNEKEQLGEIDKLIAEKSKEHTKIATKLNMVGKACKTAKQDFDEINDRVGKPCRSCGKLCCEEDIEEARKIAKEQLKNQLSELKELKAQEEIASEALKIAQIERKKITDSCIDVSDVLKLIDAQNKDLRRVEELESSISNIEKAINGMNELIENTRKKTKRVLEDMELELTEAEDKKKECLDEISTLEAVVEKLSEELAIKENVLSVFGRSGVRAHILDTVTPYLNERTSEYLSALTDGAIKANWSTLSRTTKGELREKFGISVTKEDGGETFAALSGGEKRKVRLATAMALQDLVASRATKAINFLMMDEIDGALDQSGLERLMMILESKGREKGTLLVISHNSLKEWIDTVITVVNDKGKSRVGD